MKSMNRREALVRVGYMLGGALAAPTVAGVLGGCGISTSPDWTPAVFSSEQGALLTAITEQILPETDTPGARGAGVPAFIDRMMEEWYPERLRRRFLDGLDAFEERTVETTGSSFTDLSADRQRSVLAETDLAEFDPGAGDGDANPADDPGADPYGAVDSTSAVARSALSDDLKSRVARQFGEAAERVAARRPDGGPVVRADVIHEGDLTGDPSFFRMLKELTLVGYYTSEVGATEELRFVQVPGRWEACVPFEDVGRTWAI